ncbi:MAG TPA: ferric reductase-like transmembrane domain-containing protein [Thauera sp.]|uniref:ferredoxin reductase family protein n=1 Tax=Thauera sp. TaxID=1905334 RepID=UPI002CFC634C|nr:ferric reductase-like transmembrane domain-containing protein [Thauera sp.]HRP25974.1 ferric reductase-like transmembrane domain-containing protein [Thauera sp.]HRP67753.1 ferric reductase-like transmembrane domain-containing protein [Thauera sp.]
MKRFLTAFMALITLAWAWQLFSATGAMAPAPANAWVVREHALTLTGLWSFALMSLAMVLATRPAWLERPFGGMDRIFSVHKWAGILAIGFAALHWLVEMSDDVIKTLWGREGRLPKDHGSGVLEAMRDVAEELGEFAIYALLAMLVLTLWKRFPFGIWRYLHKVMPFLYLALAFHAAFLAPLDYWTQPVGLMLAVLIAAGSFASVLALAGRIGQGRRVGGVVESVCEPGAGVTEVTCRLDAGWRGHRPGQFAFATFDRFEGAHPFTIASADRGDRRITFEIKALGDYTRGLAHRVQAGQSVQVEGPYGRFNLPTGPGARDQVWIAGGIGVTPFLAWLEALQTTPDQAPEADLYYCVRDRDSDPFVARLEALCAPLPSLRLQVISSARNERLSAAALGNRTRAGAVTEVWFCGPQGLADSLRKGLGKMAAARFRFHQEAFEMR